MVRLGRGLEPLHPERQLSLIDSEVTLFGEGESPSDVPVTGSRQIARLFENEREISGQSDMLGNLILTYTNYDADFEGSLAYNYTGERIILVGAENAPNIIEEARGQLDLLARYRFALHHTDLELELKVKNLLNDEVEWTQGQPALRELRPRHNLQPQSQGEYLGFPERVTPVARILLPVVDTVVDTGLAPPPNKY